MKLPPLVTTLAPLSGDELTRCSRHVLLPELGLTGQQRLKAARVPVVGASGLGSPALLYLAAAGGGTLGVIDFDRVDVSNLQRRVIHRMSTVGMPKTASARNPIVALDPHVDVRLHDERLDNDNAIALFSQYDLIVDGTDNFATRYLVNDACVLAGKTYVRVGRDERLCSAAHNNESWSYPDSADTRPHHPASAQSLPALARPRPAPRVW